MKEKIKSIINQTAKFKLVSGKPIEINVGPGEGHYIGPGDCIVNVEELTNKISESISNKLNIEDFVYWKLVENARSNSLESMEFLKVAKEIADYIKT